MDVNQSGYLKSRAFCVISALRDTDDVTLNFDNVVENTKDCGIKLTLVFFRIRI